MSADCDEMVGAEVPQPCGIRIRFKSCNVSSARLSVSQMFPDADGSIRVFIELARAEHAVEGRPSRGLGGASVYPWLSAATPVSRIAACRFLHYWPNRRQSSFKETSPAMDASIGQEPMLGRRPRHHTTSEVRTMRLGCIH